MKKKIVACMLTHIPAIACKSIPLISQIDLLVILLLEHQVGDMRRRLKNVSHNIKKIELVGHRIEAVNGVPQLGLLRYEQQNLLQSRMKRDDIGILMDHDIKLSAACVISSSKLRLYNKNEKERTAFWKKCGVYKIAPNHGKRRKKLTPKQEGEFVRRKLGLNYSRKLTPRVFVSRLRKLAAVAHTEGYDFFSFGYRNEPHNLRAMKGGYHMVPTWSGLVFMFKHTPNLWDVDMTISEDADVHFRIIYEKKGLGVLSDPCTVVQMEFGKEKYLDGGSQHKARLRNLKDIQKRYPGISRIKKVKSKVTHLHYNNCYGKGTKIC